MFSRALIVVLILTLGFHPKAGSAASPVVIFASDWDDNLVYMPTRIVLFLKQDTPPDRKLETQISISTGDYAHQRATIGKSGPFEHYELRSGEAGSFQYFQSNPAGPGHINYFLEDLKKIIGNKNDLSWKGPAFSALIYACQTRKNCDRFRIITARSQSQKDIFEGLSYLKSVGFIRYVPPLETIFTVGNTANPAAEKARIMIEDINRLERENPKSTWTFSDDDLGNYVSARTAISEEMKAGRIPTTKVMLFYTGMKDSSLPPEAIAFSRDGSWRALTFRERSEIFQLLKLDPQTCRLLLAAPHGLTPAVVK